MPFEFGVFHEFQRRPGQSEAEAFTTAFEQVDAAERWGLDAIWLPEIHMAPERSVCCGADDHRERDRRPHPQHQNRNRCPGLAAVPAAAACRRRRHRRSHQPRTAALWCRSQRLSARLRSLRHPLWRKPRAFCRSARGRQARVDRGKILLRRQILQLRKRKHRAEAVPPAAPADPDRGQSGRHLYFGRPARLCDLCRRAARHDRRGPAQSRDLSRGLEGGRSSRHWRGLSAGAGLCRRHDGAGAPGPGREPDEYLPLAGRAAPRVGPQRRGFRQRAAHRGGAAAADAHLRRGAARPGHHRHAGGRCRPSADPAAAVGPRRHPRRAELRAGWCRTSGSCARCS